jgi:hypothetical protein
LDKSKEDVLKRAKLLIDKSDLSEFKNERDFTFHTRGSWQKSFASEITAEFKSIWDYTLEKFNQINLEKSSQLIENIFYKLSNESINNLIQKIKKYDDYL